ncbi:MAG: ABC transporter ATP-binding protein [Clostridiales bacterium]|nr:ABC transporter ATP-binding protein [Clostridiales bacterium]
MALLQLKDIGKIYVSEGNVAVGIRGVNLSFKLGEFVAITGKSGSGKSTLLNVISGMDTYEEGELYIEGQSTSHYLQPEWEEYRERYISFIFQDYNIIESFTVLQNVELALMHIEDKKQRRERALALIDRVGLTSHLKQKGSKLSGGQKQRTVIARALAKDSPIILADEPTGNLDSQTSKEIIALLKEVSKEKLVIVVTHNFDDFKECATRHVRIFDGAIESDHIVSSPQYIADSMQSNGATVQENATAPKKSARFIREVKNGFTLGKSIFFAKPKLSVFLCLLLIVGALGVFFITSSCALGLNALIGQNNMFNYLEGRVVATNDDGTPLTDEEVAQIAQKYGAESYIRFDSILDASLGVQWKNHEGYFSSIYASVDFINNYSNQGVVGKMPQEPNEVLLYFPISYKPEFGEQEPLIEQIELWSIGNGAIYKVTGVKYYVDNNLEPKIIFTDEGLELASLMRASNRSYLDIYVKQDGEVVWSYENAMAAPCFDVEEGKIYINAYSYHDFMQANSDLNLQTEISIYGFDYLDSSYITLNEPTKWPEDYGSNNYFVYISPYLYKEIAKQSTTEYRQFSLFFANDSEASAAAEKMMEEGYIAVLSNATYKTDGIDTILNTILGIFALVYWAGAIIFLALFINLCTQRSIEAFKNDMAIMRAMGITVTAIKTGMYARMLIAIIPSYIAVILTAIAIFFNPVANAIFTFLYAWQYALMFVGLLILVTFITHRQIKKLFNTSVKKSLKGGGVA